ncbi:MAG: hypothetical protein KDI43_17950 [Gammaproteobacteria bacterium]|nr:hypothetical protein [Gammaproteobacteria bacterium]
MGALLRRWIRHELRELLGDLLSEESLKRVISNGKHAKKEVVLLSVLRMKENRVMLSAAGWGNEWF